MTEEIKDSSGDELEVNVGEAALEAALRGEGIEIAERDITIVVTSVVRMSADGARAFLSEVYADASMAALEGDALAEEFSRALCEEVESNFESIDLEVRSCVAGIVEE